MGKDWIDLLSLFDRHGVRYLIVGGWAVMFYTQPRATKDLDLYVDSEQSNAEKAYRALLEFGAPLSDFTVEDLAHPGTVYQIGQPPFRVDIMNSLSDVDFASAGKKECRTWSRVYRFSTLAKNTLSQTKSLRDGSRTWRMHSISRTQT